MDFKRVFDLLMMSNINSEDVSELIAEASTMDLSDEENQRILIRKGCSLANKEISPDMEDRIISILKEKGISNDLFSYIK